MLPPTTRNDNVTTGLQRLGATGNVHAPKINKSIERDGYVVAVHLYFGFLPLYLCLGWYT